MGLLLGALLLSVPVSPETQRFSATLPGLALITLVASVTPIAAPAAVLIAAGLANLGLSPGAVLLFATLAPTAELLGPLLRARAIVTLLCFLVAVLCDSLGLAAAPLDGALSQGDLGVRAASVLGVLLLIGVWRRGARMWLSTIVRPPPHEHEHAHDVHGPHSH